MATPSTGGYAQPGKLEYGKFGLRVREDWNDRSSNKGLGKIQEKVPRSAMIPFSARAVVPSNVLVRFLDQESVLLNLETERYFGLDAVGTRMWQVVTSAPTVDSALAQLVEEYDASPETLRTDLTKLLEHLIENGLVGMQPADVGTTSPL